MSPLPGVGKPAVVVFSSTYMRPRLSNATPSTVVTPPVTNCTEPLGVTRRIFEEPGTIGKVFRLPT